MLDVAIYLHIDKYLTDNNLLYLIVDTSYFQHLHDYIYRNKDKTNVNTNIICYLFLFSLSYYCSNIYIFIMRQLLRVALNFNDVSYNDPFYAKKY